LRDLGYEEGRSIIVEARWADGKTDRLPSLAAELVRLKVDIIIVLGAGASVAAKEVNKTIPIVMAGGSAPLEAGLVSSLARPGGNATGVTSSNVELGGKRLELLREVAPGVSRVAVLGLAGHASTPLSLKDAEDAGRALGLELLAQ
jgi:putative tryptophan/tyrosine transport system substrate-binding protein